MRRYRLEGKTPVECSPGELGSTLKNNVVAKTSVGEVYVSTVFLGLDHGFTFNGPPLVFETMVFNGPNDQWQAHYFTWDEALKGHNRVVELLTKDPGHVLG